MLGSGSATSLSKMANVGDWPWHVSLQRDETHVCDGTLVSENWVLTTESCFQGQSKATWIAVFGNIRLNAHTPWTQRRRIVSLYFLKTLDQEIGNKYFFFTDWNDKISCRGIDSSTSSP